MRIKEWIIKRLEKDVERIPGHINLKELNEDDREKCFIQINK